MDFVNIATVDATHAEIIREALLDQGITVNIIRLSPFRQLDHLRHQRRPLVDVEVLSDDAARARALLELLQIEAEAAAHSEAGEGDPMKSDDDREKEAAFGSRPLGPLSPAVGLGLAILCPVAGPIYAGASRLAFISALAHLAGFTIYLLSSTNHWYRSDLHLELGVLVIAAARFLDVVGTLQAVSQHNASLSHPADSDRAA